MLTYRFSGLLLPFMKKWTFVLDDQSSAADSDAEDEDDDDDEVIKLTTYFYAQFHHLVGIYLMTAFLFKELHFTSN